MGSDQEGAGGRDDRQGCKGKMLLFFLMVFGKMGIMKLRGAEFV